MAEMWQCTISAEHERFNGSESVSDDLWTEGQSLITAPLSPFLTDKALHLRFWQSLNAGKLANETLEVSVAAHEKYKRYLC